ncbi:hypothetical protein ACQ86N_17920 [Puia sp. P3]|uniref:hypothetical protein n=1 Tax=Puia sp. P3 TaxID=3423952 RepID=UPI003D666E77
MARRLDISVNTVKTQIRLAYQYLRVRNADGLCIFIFLFYKKNNKWNHPISMADCLLTRHLILSVYGQSRKITSASFSKRLRSRLRALDPAARFPVEGRLAAAEDAHRRRGERKR